MEMLHDNCVIAEEIFTEVVRYNRDAIHICVTNPLDVITMKIQQVTGQAPRKVIGSGTLLESARLVRYVADLLEISDRSIHMSVVGEHGASAVALMSSVRVMGLPLEEYLQSVTDHPLRLNTQRLTEAFQQHGFRIFHGKGYTSTGVSATACRIVAAIASDSREVFPVSTVLQGGVRRPGRGGLRPLRHREKRCGGHPGGLHDRGGAGGLPGLRGRDPPGRRGGGAPIRSAAAQLKRW